MSSESVPSQIPPTNPSSLVGNTRPTARDIKANLISATTPADFIKNNLNGAIDTSPQEIVKTVEAQRFAANLPAEVIATTEGDKNAISPQQVTEKKEMEGDSKNNNGEKGISFTPEVDDAPRKFDGGGDTGNTEEKTEGAEGEDSEENGETSKETNFAVLRKSIREAKQALKEKDAAAQELATKLSKYETGEVVPEVLKAQTERIAELEKYETIHNLKSSRAYKEKFIKPLTDKKSELNKIATDYGIPEAVMEGALEITNRAELNGFLSEHFDDVGALEAKNLITGIQEIKNASRAAEATPSTYLEQLEEEHEQIQVMEDNKRKENIATTSRRAWGDSLNKIREEGEASELIYREGDNEHNDNYVKPILSAAATEYGKLVTMLAESGLKTLTPELSFALARTVQLAHASAVSIKVREAALKHAEEIEANSKRTSRFVRPQVGGSGGSTSSGKEPSYMNAETPQAAARGLLNSILSKR